MLDLASFSQRLYQRDDGIWCAPSISAVSYPDDGNSVCADLEGGSFWFEHRNNCILALANALPPQHKVLFDIGGGNGFVAAALQTAGYETVMVEPGAAGANAALARGINHVVCSTLQDAGFAPASLPAVGLFDVVEHIEDDLSFMKAVNQLLQPGGRVYATVPAYQWLWSNTDVEAGHFRRHTLGSISTLFTRAGFTVDYASYMFRFLPLPTFLMRVLPARVGITGRSGQAHQDHAAGGGRSRVWVERLLATEIDHVQRLSPMRMGGSCLVAASKRE